MLFPLCSLVVTPALAGGITPLHDGPLLADGRTESVVYLRIPGLVADDKLKLKLSGARLVSQVLGPHQTVVLSVQPDKARRPGEVQLSVKVRGGISVSETVRLPTVPAPEGTLALGFEPAVVTPGMQSVRVFIEPSGAEHLPLDARRVAVSASRGSLSPPERSQGGWTALYTPPEQITAPVAVLFTATDLSAPSRVRGLATLPHATVHTLTFTGSPREEATLFVGDRSYGPYPFSTAGTVSMDVDVRPGDLAEARLRTGSADSGQERPVELPKPSVAAQVGWAPVGRPVFTRSESMWLAVAREDGQPDSDAFKLKLKGGTVSEEGGGWYSVPADDSFRFDAQLEFESALLEGTRLAWPAPEAFSFEGTPLPEDATEIAWTGRGDAIVVADGAEVAENKLVLPEGSDRVAAIAHAAVPVSDNPPVRLRVWPVVEAVDHGVLPVAVVAEDAFGVPVTGLQVSVTTPTGDRTIRIPNTGVGVAAYKVGSIEGPVPVQARSGTLLAGTVIWQGVPEPDLPELGTTADGEALALWRGAIRGAGVARPVRIPPAPASPDGRATEAGKAPPASGDEPVVDRRPPQTEAPEPLSISEAPSNDGWWTGSSSDAQLEPSAGPEDDGPVVLLQAGFSDVGHRYRQSAAAGNLTVPSEASFAQSWPGGALGVAGRLSARLRRSGGPGVDLRGRWGRYRMDLDGLTQADGLGSWQIAGTYRAQVGAVAVGGLAGFHRFDFVGFVYDDEQTGPELRQLVSNGARVGASAGVEIGDDLFVEAELAETFSLAPVDTWVGLGAMFRLPVDVGGVSLLATADLGFEFRHLGVTLAGETVRVNDRQDTLILGVALGNP